MNRPPSPSDVAFSWSTTIRVERRGCPDAVREITVTGDDVLAAPGEGKAFGATAIARAMHASSQKVSAAVKEMRGDA